MLLADFVVCSGPVPRVGLMPKVLRVYLQQTNIYIGFCFVLGLRLGRVWSCHAAKRMRVHQRHQLACYESVQALLHLPCPVLNRCLSCHVTG